MLLPFDIDAFRKDVADGKAGSRDVGQIFRRVSIRPNSSCPGPAGYDATFVVNREGRRAQDPFRKADRVRNLRRRALSMTSMAPTSRRIHAAQGLGRLFPGIRRILREAHVRYVFERFGVPYVLSIQCYDMRPSSKYLSCREADPLAVKFPAPVAHGRRHAGKNRAAEIRPQPAGKPQSDFTYYGPGDLIENTGWKKMPGRVDYHVYARMRFPIADAPAYVKSQSFMPWGDCYRTGMVGRHGPARARRTAARSTTSRWCSTNRRRRISPIRGATISANSATFWSASAPAVTATRARTFVPRNCVLNNAEADRCLPYQDYVAAVHDGVIRRMPRKSRRLYRGQYAKTNTSAFATCT